MFSRIQLRTLTETISRSHPHISYELSLRRLVDRPEFLMLLGEAQSKCEHVASVPLSPETAQELHQLYLAKGIGATAAIEGNTLTTDQVRLALEGKLQLPPSSDYQRQEVDNILRACNWLVEEVLQRELPLSVELIKRLNAMVLDKLPLEEEVTPGSIRRHSVGVLDYRGPPPEHCQAHLARLCAWVNEMPNEFWPGRRIPTALIKAVVVHIYIAWIHPFGDGNGRTARLLELLILTEAGVSSPVAHLLSNHYNATRSAYYRELSKTSKTGGRLEDFIEYALQGFVDGLVEQLNTIRNHQLRVAWVNYIHDRFRGQKTDAGQRRRDLAIALGLRGFDWTHRNEVGRINAELAAAYGKGGDKTIARDLNKLEEMELVVRRRDARLVRGRIELMGDFFAQRKLQDSEREEVQAQLKALQKNLDPNEQEQLPFPSQTPDSRD